MPDVRRHRSSFGVFLCEISASQRLCGEILSSRVQVVMDGVEGQFQAV
jgi:hypothetical protein